MTQHLWHRNGHADNNGAKNNLYYSTYSLHHVIPTATTATCLHMNMTVFKSRFKSKIMVQ